MLLSKAIKNTSLVAQLALITFSTSNQSPASQLNHQILHSKSWSEFYKLFNANKQSFTPDTFHVSSRFISQLLSRERQTISYVDFNEIVSYIQTLDVSTIPQTNIISILALLRSFCFKGLDIHNLYKLKNKLCSRYTDILINKPMGKENISELIYAFYEMAYFGWQPGSRFISERILNRINNQPENISILTLNQCTFALNALATKGDLSVYERKLRFYILKTLANKIDLLKLQDLVNSMISINKMDFHDANSQQFVFIKILGNKMLENITELQEKSIFEFLKGDHNNENPIFFRIYEAFIKSTYREIQQNGNTTFDSKTVLKLISHLSSRYNFNRHTELEKKKLYNLLKTSAKTFAAGFDTQGTKQLHMNIQEMLRNRYHDLTKNEEIVQILSIDKIPIRHTLLEVLYNIKVDISEFLISFLENPLSQNSSITTMIKLSSFLRKVAKNPRYQAYAKSIESYLQPATKKIEAIFQSPQTFSDNFNFLFRNQETGIHYRTFDQTHESYFSRLPNPFELDESATTPFYKLAYLNYVVNAFKAKDFYNFIKDHNQKINNSVIARVIFNHVNQDSRKIEPNKFIVHLVVKNLSKGIDQKQKEFINASFELLNKYNRFVVCNDRDFQLAKNIIKIINTHLNKLQTLKECEAAKNFFNVFGKYITKNNGNYKNEEIFRDILINSFRILDKFPSHITVQLLKQGLRLNLIQKKALEKIDFSKLNNLNFFEKQTLAYIQDNTKVTDITTINSASLTAIFANHNLYNLIEQKQAEINQALEKAFINDLVACLTVFNQPKTRVTGKILAKIFDLITSHKATIQRCDFQGAMNNLLDKGLNNVMGVKDFAQKVITLLTNKMGLFSIWTHTEAIKFAISIPSYNPTEYYNKLIQYTQKFFNDNEVEEVLYKLAFTNYEFRSQDLKYVQSSLKKNTFRGIYLFLATENMHSDADRKLIVQQIVKKVSETKEGQPSIQNFQYEYLKRAYPQETKDLNLQPNQLQKAIYFVRPRPKVLNILEELAKFHQITLQTLPDFQQNHIIKIKNLCVCFLHSKRNGCFHEHEFLKRFLNLYYKDQGYTFMFCGFTKVNKVPEYIEKNAPELITPQFKQYLNEYMEKHREKVEQDEHQQKSTEKREQKKNQKKPRNRKSQE